MLKGIDRRLTADLLHVLMRMGHGDEILICDREPSRRHDRGGDGPAALHRDGGAVCAGRGRPIALEPLERFAFYTRARSAFAVVRTSDPGPYGCFLSKKGVI